MWAPSKISKPLKPTGTAPGKSTGTNTATCQNRFTLRQERGTKDMAGKPISRSMRFSEATYSMIEQQAGENFSAKFEALVTKCCWELPRKEKELEQIKKQIENERQRLQRIQKKAIELENLMFRMTSTVQSFDRSAGDAIRNLKKIIDEM